MKKGYFDEFRELRETHGKIIKPSENTIPFKSAMKFPKFQV